MAASEAAGIRQHRQAVAVEETQARASGVDRGVWSGTHASSIIANRRERFVRLTMRWPSAALSS